MVWHSTVEENMHGVAQFVTAWGGTAQHHIAQEGTTRHGTTTQLILAWDSTGWHSLEWDGTAWDGPAWHSMARRGTACHRTALLHLQQHPQLPFRVNTQHSKSHVPMGWPFPAISSPPRTGHTWALHLHRAVTQRVPARGAAGRQLRATPLISFIVFLKAS